LKKVSLVGQDWQRPVIEPVLTVSKDSPKAKSVTISKVTKLSHLKMSIPFSPFLSLLLFLTMAEI